MAFDDSTRNRLNGFVGSARDLLVAEFTWQLNQTYGLDPATGAVTDLDALGHLDDQRLETARILREIMAHYLGAVVTPSAKQRAQVLDRILREQAFTVLNRLAALRLMEARGILIESVAKGYQSKAFQLYQRVAGTALGETGDTYRIFLFSLFDMFAADLPGLFDRYSPMGRLFPREPAFLDLLALMNAPDLEPLWGEDETIGWIYQYFNSAEERKRMRKESAAPRDSRELAVRNQFFTPRYVVEFLVDNTLGRQWVNMTGGRTRLMEDRRYLVYTPDEVFLGRMSVEDEASARIAKALLDGRWDDLPDFDDPRTGRQAMIEFAHCVDAYSRHPDGWGEYFGRLQPVLHGMRFDGATTQELWDGLFLECRADRHGGDGRVYGERWFRATVEEILTRLKREDLAKRPTLVAFQALRDPRIIRLLDPACGSMHFGLYAFDVFEVIYRESWAIEQAEGSQRLERPDGMAPLSDTYADEQAYLRDVPRLIIDHNIWGVDIDPRAVQIASLALWLRAQRAWKEMGVPTLERPAVGKGNVVAAVAPPAEVDLRDALKIKMAPLDAELFERTLGLLNRLPDLGVLLKIEEQIPQIIVNLHSGYGPLFSNENESIWGELKDRLHINLMNFARSPEKSYARRLFVTDSLSVLQFMDLCRKKFDAIVMNPPFGAPSSGSKTKISEWFPNSKNDLLSTFVERMLDFLTESGLLGAITSRAPFFLGSMENWRKSVVLGKGRPCIFVDLGMGVMDDAMVEAAAFVMSMLNNPSSSEVNCIRALKGDQKAELVRTAAADSASPMRYIMTVRSLIDSPSSAFSYWIKEETIRKLSSLAKLDPSLVSVRVGMQTGDDWRFLRQWWEVKPDDYVIIDESGFPSKVNDRVIGKWATYTKTDRSSPWFSPLTQVVNWKSEGKEYDYFLNNAGKPRAALRSRDLYFKPGFSYMLRSARIVPYIVPAGAIPTAGRAQAFGVGDDLIKALMIASSNLGSAWARLTGEKFEWPKFQAGMVQSIPVAIFSDVFLQASRALIKQSYLRRRAEFEGHEPHREFSGPEFLRSSIEDYKWTQKTIIGDEFDRMIAQQYQLSDDEFCLLQTDLMEALDVQVRFNDQDDEDDGREHEISVYINRSEDSKAQSLAALISYIFGCVFGRWDIRFAINGASSQSEVDPFCPVPQVPPAWLRWDELTAAERIAYPIPVALSGVTEHSAIWSSQIVDRVHYCVDLIRSSVYGDHFKKNFQDIYSGDVADFLTRPSGFFSYHLEVYSGGGRKAPIYWPLSTPSGRYTLWLYYPALTDQTLFTAANDFVEPKLEQTTRALLSLRTKSGRSRQEERELEELETFEQELKDLRAELLRLAPGWKPNHDDGVQITAAPLWPLFRHAPWQKLLRETWEKLEAGEYDWAHLAMAYWPDRVQEKCRTDRSLAIAHDLEHLYEPPPETEAKPKRGRKPK